MSRRLVACSVLASLAGFSTIAVATPFKLIVSDLTTPLVPNSVMDLAGKLGYFAREGVEVELVRVQQTPSAIAALRSGEGDMANIAVDAALQLVARGQMHLKAVVSPNKSLPYLIAARDEITRTGDLPGHSFGIGRIGSLDHTLTNKVLATLDVPAEKVDFVAIGQPDVRAKALVAGQIDATTMSIGAWLAIPDKAELHVLVPPDAYYAAAPIVSKFNVVTDEVLKTKRDEVTAVTRALVKISRDFAIHPEHWVDAMVGARPDVARADLEALAASFARSWSINGGLARGELEQTEDWLYATPDFAGLKKVTLPDWVDFSILDGILADLGTAPGFDQPTR